MLARLGAIFFCLVLLFAAFTFRNQSTGTASNTVEEATDVAQEIDDSVEGEGDLAEPDEPAETGSLVICDPNFADLCQDYFNEGVELLVQEPGEALASIVDGSARPSHWLTSRAFLAMAAEPTVNRNVQPQAVYPVASTPLLVAARDGGCDDWACASEEVASGSRVGLDSFSTSAGVAQAAVLTAQQYGPDASLSTVPSTWSSALADASQPSDQSAALIMVTRPGTFTMAITTESVWDGVVRQGFDATDPAPPAQLVGDDELVVALGTFASSSDDSTAEDLSAVLSSQTGWSPPTELNPPPIDPGLLWSLTQKE